MPFTSPTQLNYNHQYVETIYMSANQLQPEAYRAILRTGAYAPALGRASGISFFERYGFGNLAFNSVFVDPAISPPDLTTAVTYPAGGTAVLAGAILSNPNTNTYYYVPANVTLDAVGATLDARIVNDLASGAVVEIPKHLILNNLNASDTIYSPTNYNFQRTIPMCTDGIPIVEIATLASATAAGVTATATLTKDQPLYVVDDFGRVGGIAAPAATDYVIGVCLDDVDVPADAVGFGVPAGYVRIKLGSI